MNRESVHHPKCVRVTSGLMGSDHKGDFCRDADGNKKDRRDPKREDRKQNRRVGKSSGRHRKDCTSSISANLCPSCNERFASDRRHSERRKADKGVNEHHSECGHKDSDHRRCCSLDGALLPWIRTDNYVGPFSIPVPAPVVHTVEAAKEKPVQKLKVSFGPVPELEEVEFAKGGEIETQNIRVTYANLAEFTNPTARFPRIYKMHGDGTVSNLGLTPAEGRYLRDVLAEMFPEKS